MSRTNAKGKKQAEREVRRRAAERRNRIKLIAGLGLGIVALVALFVAVWPEPDVGSTSATAWDLPELDGEGRITLDDFSGKPTVAAFFASWCEVCEEEFPEFAEVATDLGPEINFVGINSQDNGRGLGDAEKWGIAGAWPLARDIGGGNGSGLSVGTFGARGMPLTVFYTSDGDVAHVQPGGLTGHQLRQVLGELFGIDAQA